MSRYKQMEMKLSRMHRYLSYTWINEIITSKKELLVSLQKFLSFTPCVIIQVNSLIIGKNISCIYLSLLETILMHYSSSSVKKWERGTCCDLDLDSLISSHDILSLMIDFDCDESSFLDLHTRDIHSSVP